MRDAADRAIRHLLLRLRPLNRALAAAVDRQAAAAARLARPDVAPLCITDDQVATLLADVDAQAAGLVISDGAPSLSPDEAVDEEALRAAAAAEGARLPLDRLQRDLELSVFEVEAILLCVAPELDRAYERIYGYILDDLNRRAPCVELLAGLTAPTFAERATRVRALGPLGRLRRHGVIRPVGDAPTALRQTLRLAPIALDALLGASLSSGIFADPDVVELDRDRAPEALAPPLAALARAFGDGGIEVVGLWGAHPDDLEETVGAFAALAGRSLRRLPLRQLRASDGPEHEVRARLQAAVALDAAVLISTDALEDPAAEPLRAALLDALVGLDVSVVISGRHPWRPTALLAARNYGEHRLTPPDFAARQAIWSDALPGVDATRAAALAARYRLSRNEVRAVARVALSRSLVRGDGPVTDHLEAACQAVTRKRSDRFATAIEPRRGASDLVLPPELHTRVMEIARFFRAWPTVGETWGFARRMTGGGGIKALFTGDPGTGKTLSAEVIAHELGLQLLKVDLARITSKWVGETEKNLQSAFREAKESHAVLFFDEAEALFGKRADVRHGTDRYANLEVSYLLQQLEEHDGLVILASNLKEQIDKAFFRRFHVVVHFPRPGRDERKRIWQIAFPAAAPLAPDVELDALLELDMTGASITSAARTAALIAADAGAEAISMRHVVQGVVRRYHHEARVLRPRELGQYAGLLDEGGRGRG